MNPNTVCYIILKFFFPKARSDDRQQKKKRNPNPNSMYYILSALSLSLFGDGRNHLTVCERGCVALTETAQKTIVETLEPTLIGLPAFDNKALTHPPVEFPAILLKSGRQHAECLQDTTEKKS